MNWGKKILLVYLGFVAIMLVMANASMQQTVDLVTPDYYAQELSFQKKIDASNNSAASKIKWKIEPSDVGISLSVTGIENEKAISGSVQFFRASDSKHDVVAPINLDSSYKQFISSSKFIKGAYIIKIDWMMNNVNFFEQQNIFIP